MQALNNPQINDYAEPLLLMRRMLNEYEELLRDRKWAEARDMGPVLTVQLRLLVQTVRMQTEDNPL